jgi:hypothetical protein
MRKRSHRSLRGGAAAVALAVTVVPAGGAAAADRAVYLRWQGHVVRAATSLPRPCTGSACHVRPSQRFPVVARQWVTVVAPPSATAVTLYLGRASHAGYERSVGPVVAYAARSKGRWRATLPRRLGHPDVLEVVVATAAEPSRRYFVRAAR